MDARIHTEFDLQRLRRAHHRGAAVAAVRTVGQVTGEVLSTTFMPTRDGWADLKYDLDTVLIGFKELAGLRKPAWVKQSRVSPTLWRGTRLDGDDPQALSSEAMSGALSRVSAMKVRAIVDLRAEASHDAKIARQAKLGFLSLPIVDNWHPTFRQVRQFLDFVSEPKNQPVYVHCLGGIGRTGVMVACYRLAVEGWSAERALAEMQGFTQTPLRPNQAAFVRRFEQKLEARQAGLTPERLAHWRANAR